MAIFRFCYRIEANGASNNEKQKHISKAVSVFKRLKFRLRLASENKLISHASYAHFIKQSIEISKMLNGWLTWSKRI